MPNIRGFDAPSGLGLQPSEIGVESTAAAARRIGMYGNQAAAALEQTGARIGSTVRDVGEAVDNYETHREVSVGSAAFAQKQLDLTQQWEEMKKNADPNDPSVAAKFDETILQPTLDKLTENFSTERAQNFAQAKADALRQHFMIKTQADMSTLAGIAVHKNVEDSITAASNTAILDPTSVPHLLADADHTIAGLIASSPNLRAEDAARVNADVSRSYKAAIIKGGAIGAIQKSGDPEATADEWIRKYPDYINGDEAKALATNARSQIRARNYDYDQNRKRQKEIAQDRSNDATNQYLIDVRSKDPRLQSDPTAQKILNDPNLLKTDKNNLLNYIDRQLKPETDSRTSQQTFVGLLRALRDPNADPSAVMQKAWDARLMDPGKPGSLSEKDFDQFRNEVVAQKTPEGAALERDRAAFFKNYAAAISGQGNTYQPGVGDPKVYSAEMDARRMENMLRSKGMDPHLAYDPSSEYFLGKPERLAKWQQSLQLDLQTRAQAPAQASPAPAPEDRRGPLVPARLRGIAALSYSRARNLWRDDTTGKVYNAQGDEVGK